MFSRICRETNIAEMSSSAEDNSGDFQQEVFESDGMFAQDILVNQDLLDQVSKTSDIIKALIPNFINTLYVALLYQKSEPEF